MIKIANIKNVLLVILMLFCEYGHTCSMYKITVNGKTMIGCNEDAWRTTPHIWFEVGKVPNQYGAAFTGSRFDGTNGYAPQSGMNEAGLAYSRLASMAPEIQTVSGHKKSILNPTMYLKEILHRCKTVEEVKAYIDQYDHSFFIEDVFIYVEKSGKYLVVEPYAMTMGTNANYVLSNFCPSVTPASDALKLDRYRKGVAFVKDKAEASLAFCTAMSDTMHVCRDKIGDGTLLTSIWDSENGTVHLYFYHRYEKSVAFNLKEELAKGNHSIAIAPLFARNAEFEKLGAYKIPPNDTSLTIFLMVCGVLFLFSAFYFGITYLRKYSKIKYAKAMLVMFPLGLCLFYFMFVLCTNLSVFYFPAPYIDPHNLWVTAATYLPFVLLVLIVPMVLTCFCLFRQNVWNPISKWLFAINNGLYLILLVLFGYWGFFGI